MSPPLGEPYPNSNHENTTPIPFAGENTLDINARHHKELPKKWLLVN